MSITSVLNIADQNISAPYNEEQEKIRFFGKTLTQMKGLLSSAFVKVTKKNNQEILHYLDLRANAHMRAQDDAYATFSSVNNTIINSHKLAPIPEQSDTPAFLQAITNAQHASRWNNEKDALLFLVAGATIKTLHDVDPRISANKKGRPSQHVYEYTRQHTSECISNFEQSSKIFARSVKPNDAFKLKYELKRAAQHHIDDVTFRIKSDLYAYGSNVDMEELKQKIQSAYEQYRQDFCTQASQPKGLIYQ